ncbi:Protein N-acetyltransferase, RimJ/RimL family [Lachnospiraceae bacterium C10]|nr:Protein N-acetyltransferase, RimJ/RimL family [Lachnospiraceae bacterium C10]
MTISCEPKALLERYQVAIYRTEEERVELDHKGMAAIGFEEDDSLRLRGPFIIQSMEALTEDFVRKVYCRYHNLPLTILTTERTVVREMDPSADLDALFMLYQGEGMTDYVEPLYPYEEEKEYEETYVKNVYELYDFGMWNVFSKESGKLIGRAGLEERALEVDITLDAEDSWLELGYMVDAGEQGKGLGTEICAGILEYARSYDRHAFYCRIHPDNTPSVCLAAKLGFIKYKTDFAAGEDLWVLLD